MKKLLDSFAAVISVPMGYMNAFGGIVAFIWLIIAGEWSIVIFGLIAIFTSHFLIAILFMPSLGIDLIGMFFYKSKMTRILAYPFFYIGAGLNSIIICIWAFVVYNFALQESETSVAKFALTLWAYGVTTGPIQWMATKEPADSVGTTLMVFFTMLGSMWLTFSVGLFNFNFDEAFLGMLLSMFICINVMFYLTVTEGFKSSS